MTIECCASPVPDSKIMKNNHDGDSTVNAKKKKKRRLLAGLRKKLTFRTSKSKENETESNEVMVAEVLVNPSNKVENMNRISSNSSIENFIKPLIPNDGRSTSFYIDEWTNSFLREHDATKTVGRKLPIRRSLRRLSQQFSTFLTSRSKKSYPTSQIDKHENDEDKIDDLENLGDDSDMNKQLNVIIEDNHSLNLSNKLSGKSFDIFRRSSIPDDNDEINDKKDLNDDEVQSINVNKMMNGEKVENEMKEEKSKKSEELSDNQFPTIVTSTNNSSSISNRSNKPSSSSSTVMDEKEIPKVFYVSSESPILKFNDINTIPLITSFNDSSNVICQSTSSYHYSNQFYKECNNQKNYHFNIDNPNGNSDRKNSLESLTNYNSMSISNDNKRMNNSNESKEEQNKSSDSIHSFNSRERQRLSVSSISSTSERMMSIVTTPNASDASATTATVRSLENHSYDLSPYPLVDVHEQNCFHQLNNYDSNERNDSNSIPSHSSHQLEITTKLTNSIDDIPQISLGFIDSTNGNRDDNVKSESGKINENLLLTPSNEKSWKARSLDRLNYPMNGDSCNFVQCLHSDQKRMTTSVLPMSVEVIMEFEMLNDGSTNEMIDPQIQDIISYGLNNLEDENDMEDEENDSGNKNNLRISTTPTSTDDTSTKIVKHVNFCESHISIPITDETKSAYSSKDSYSTSSSSSLSSSSLSPNVRFSDTFVSTSINCELSPSNNGTAQQSSSILKEFHQKEPMVREEFFPIKCHQNVIHKTTGKNNEENRLQDNWLSQIDNDGSDSSHTFSNCDKFKNCDKNNYLFDPYGNQAIIDNRVVDEIDGNGKFYLFYDKTDNDKIHMPIHSQNRFEELTNSISPDHQSSFPIRTVSYGVNGRDDDSMTMCCTIMKPSKENNVPLTKHSNSSTSTSYSSTSFITQSEVIPHRSMDNIYTTSVFNKFSPTLYYQDSSIFQANINNNNSNNNNYFKNEQNNDLSSFTSLSNMEEDEENEETDFQVMDGHVTFKSNTLNKHLNNSDQIYISSSCLQNPNTKIKEVEEICKKLEAEYLDSDIGLTTQIVEEKSMEMKPSRNYCSIVCRFLIIFFAVIFLALCFLTLYGYDISNYLGADCFISEPSSTLLDYWERLQDFTITTFTF
ncbi:hypothetical protein SNEBB_005459 [Seison nebaliae]|nr:hypothetical protein SNEBB_005459 [Seison nebaliae]